MQIYMLLFRALGLLLLLLVSVAASGQVVPDTVYRKPSLPAGPPGEVPEQPRPRTQPRPPVTVQSPAPEPDSLQYEEKVPVIDRLYYGGGLGLQFGTYTSVSLSPIIGYMVNEKFWTGGGIMYDYFSVPGASLQNYGIKGFAQYAVLEYLLVHLEYDVLSVERFQNSSRETVRTITGIPLAGLGYRQRIGTRASADILVLYNFDNSPQPVYSNPVIRASFNIPFKR